jgi:hypothetical protein
MLTYRQLRQPNCFGIRKPLTLNLTKYATPFWAASHDLAREDCEENFRQNKAENRRNTLCISRFDNAVMAEICRKTPQTQ